MAENHFSSGFVQVGFVRENRLVIHGDLTRFHATARDSVGRHSIAMVNDVSALQMQLADKDLDALTDWLIERRETIKRQNDAVDKLLASVVEPVRDTTERLVINAGMEHAL